MPGHGGIKPHCVGSVPLAALPVVDLDQLESLDLLLWMAGSYRAAQLANSNQSTIIRRAQTVLATFGVTIRREPSGWSDRGDTRLLAMEREVHQRFRFLGRGRLRLHVPLWSLPLALERLPSGWMHNPEDREHVCENPVALLRERIIDACLVTPTQMPADTGGLAMFEIYRSPIELTILSPRGGGDPPLRRALEEGRLDLRLFPFLPRSCREASRKWFERLRQSMGHHPESRRAREASAGLEVAFLTPQMRRFIDRPWVVDAATPRHYCERLLVRAEKAQEPLFLALLDHLQQGCLSSRAAMPSHSTVVAVKAKRQGSTSSPATTASRKRIP